MAEKLTLRERALLRFGDFAPTEADLQKKMEELAEADALEENAAQQKRLAKENKTKRKGTGRPPSRNPRTNHLNFKLSDAEVEQLEYAAEVFGVKKTKIVAMGIERICAEAVAKVRSQARRNAEAHGGHYEEQ